MDPPISEMHDFVAPDPRDAEIASLRAEVEALRSAIESANQRLNESGTGQMGLIDTIHATASILRAALGAA